MIRQQQMHRAELERQSIARLQVFILNCRPLTEQDTTRIQALRTQKPTLAPAQR